MMLLRRWRTRYRHKARYSSCYEPKGNPSAGC